MKNWRQWILPALLVGGGFIIGLVVFFPLNDIVAAMLAKSSSDGVKIEAGRLHLTTGYKLGFGKGSLFGFETKNLRITMGPGGSVRCEEAILAPRILPLLIGQLQAGVGCSGKGIGEAKVLVKLSPAWAPKSVSAEAEITKLDLRLIDNLFRKGSYSGTLTGEVTVNDLSLPMRSGLPPLEWNIKGQNIVTPPVTTMMFVMPSARLGSITTTGHTKGSKLALSKFDFGSDETNVEGSLKADFTMGPGGLPSGGQWSGRLRTSPDFQAAFTDIDLDMTLGKPGADGFRQFTKSF